MIERHSASTAHTDSSHLATCAANTVAPSVIILALLTSHDDPARSQNWEISDLGWKLEPQILTSVNDLSKATTVMMVKHGLTLNVRDTLKESIASKPTSKYTTKV